MAYDIATDPNTGDWIFSANRDWQIVQGEQVIAQQIRHRLRIYRGTWRLDPSNGALGSRLYQMLRLPRGRAIREARLMVEEALAPMTNITITDVTVEENTNSLTLHISYQIDEGDDFLPASDRLNNSLTFDIPT